MVNVLDLNHLEDITAVSQIHGGKVSQDASASLKNAIGAAVAINIAVVTPININVGGFKYSRK